MTDYMSEEIETDAIADEVARERDRVTVLPDEPNDIPLDQAVAEMERISQKLRTSLCLGSSPSDEQRARILARIMEEAPTVNREV